MNLKLDSERSESLVERGETLGVGVRLERAAAALVVLERFVEQTLLFGIERGVLAIAHRAEARVHVAARAKSCRMRLECGGGLG